MDLKADLHGYLRSARSALLWKLDGISEYDARRPLVATGTNLLGLVKHCATVEWGHFGAAFGRPLPESLPWVGEGSEQDADMWAAPDETRAGIVALYAEITARADAVIEELPLDAVGEVPWWPPEIRQVTLQHILVHTVAEVQRHAGHADIVRELVDGAAGYQPGTELLPDGDRDWWQQRRERLEKIARDA
ncbi:DinB family protein [Pseudonocardia sp. CA-107938]|uniref:DinB family protein n=1 Tax=Pseudonocardia sp. CA-107938 TaxID=3240021 RepID=UPI003D8A600B